MQKEKKEAAAWRLRTARGKTPAQPSGQAPGIAPVTGAARQKAAKLSFPSLGTVAAQRFEGALM